jgi:hypothetical protein
MEELVRVTAKYDEEQKNRLIPWSKFDAVSWSKLHAD